MEFALSKYSWNTCDLAPNALRRRSEELLGGRWLEWDGGWITPYNWDKKHDRAISHETTPVFASVSPATFQVLGMT
jgi:hypothetical protein